MVDEALLSKVKPLISQGTRVIFLGDGGFDGTLLQAELEWSNWHYVVRRLLTAGYDMAKNGLVLRL